MKQVLFVSLRDDDRVARLALDASGAVEPLAPVAVSSGPASRGSLGTTPMWITAVLSEP